MNDKLLIKYIKKRKDKGIEMLVDRYGGFITSIVRRYLGALKTYEEECVNDVLLGVWDNIEKFDGGKNTFKNWVGVISKHKAINYKKKYIKELESCEIEEDAVVYLDNNLEKRELEEEMNDLLSHLNEKDRSIFKQYYLDDISLDEIAKENNTNVNNLYNRISRGRKKLREVYKG